VSEPIREPSLLINGEWVPGTGPECEVENPATVTVSAWEAGPAVPVHDEAPDNVLLTRTFTAGDVTAALAQADLVLERDLITELAQ